MNEVWKEILVNIWVLYGLVMGVALGLYVCYHFQIVDIWIWPIAIGFGTIGVFGPMIYLIEIWKKKLNFKEA